MTRKMGPVATGVAFEALDARTLFSSVLHDSFRDLAENLGRGDARGAGPEIRLDLVALHELGHALGLQHTSDTKSIMYPYYNANYDLNNFANDSAVASLRQMYSSANVAANATPWKDSLDANPSNGTVNLTYSFTQDGAAMDQGSRSSMFAAFDRIFGAGQWESVFATQLARWAAASNGEIAFSPFDSDGIENAIYSFNTSGQTQNDSRFGDIRIAAHKFDGPGKVLAHTYYPPPNGVTAAGDSHYDSAENWVLGSGAFSTQTYAAASQPGADGTGLFSANPIRHARDLVLSGDAAA